MKKGWIILIILALIIGVIIFFTKCGGFKSNKPENANKPATAKTIDATLYYANKQYILTGDDALDKVIPVEMKIDYTDTTINMAIFNKLKQNPGIFDAETAIPEKARALSIINEDGLLTINLTGIGISGTLTEELVVEQIVRTFLDIQGARGVKFLIDGQESETLMGHIDITKPFYKTYELKSEELSIGGMRLGQKRSEFVKSYGQPLVSSLTPNKQKEFINYTDFKAVIRGGKVIQISTTSDKYGTYSGVKVGQDVNKVIETYGEPALSTLTEKNEPSRFTYEVGSEGIINILFTSGKVSEILIRAQDQ